MVGDGSVFILCGNYDKEGWMCLTGFRFARCGPCDGYDFYRTAMIFYYFCIRIVPVKKCG